MFLSVCKSCSGLFQSLLWLRYEDYCTVSACREPRRAALCLGACEDVCKGCVRRMETRPVLIRSMFQSVEPQSKGVMLAEVSVYLREGQVKPRCYRAEL